jgi:predicted dehydrogenase
MKSTLSRKNFLALSAMSGLGWTTGCATSGRRQITAAPGGKLRHACIGVGGMMGGHDLKSFQSHPRLEIAALCDVDKKHLEAAAQQVPGARLYTDWRKMLAQERDRIDACSITVPDHMHAIIALAAMRQGKHVYCQKPLAHDVAECRALARAARQMGVVTQLGTQFAAGIGDRQAVEFLRAGVIGKVRRVVLCSNRRSGAAYRLEGPRPAESQPPPETLNWDIWLGTAPERPYAPEIYHPAKWRAWQDFGTGWSGDIGCHIFDAVWKGLKLTAPETVTAEVQASWHASKERRADTWPQSNHITWIFPGNSYTEQSKLPVEWFDGEMYPPEEVQSIALSEGFSEYPEEAAMVIGSKGALLLPHRSGPVLFPRAQFQKCPRNVKKGPDHYHRFVDACLGGEKTASSFGQSGPMAEAIILGTVAIRMPGETLIWEPRGLCIPNSPEATRLLRRTYRKGWEVDLGI